MGSTGGKKRPADCLDDDHEDVKRKRYEDENLEETVAEIVADIEDQNKLMGPQVITILIFIVIDKVLVRSVMMAARINRKKENQTSFKNSKNLQFAGDVS